MKFIEQEYIQGGRALSNIRNAKIINSVFYDGESPLKHSSNIEIIASVFKWKYPLWHCQNLNCYNCTFVDGARSGVWYSNQILFDNCSINTEKMFRKTKNIKLSNVTFPVAKETLWMCENIILNNVFANGDYFAMNSNNLTIDRLKLYGNYSFDGCENIEVRNSVLISKDAFWNCKNVTVIDSVIIGEYLAWYSENITFINCIIESSQGFNTIKKLKITGGTLIKTTMAFECCEELKVDVSCHIDSVKNPISGRIKAKKIGNIENNSDKIVIIETDEKK